jgi:hypothetical protein
MSIHLLIVIENATWNENTNESETLNEIVTWFYVPETEIQSLGRVGVHSGNRNYWNTSAPKLVVP